jgi:uncharacterized protein YigE (DUF2233 family)
MLLPLFLNVGVSMLWAEPETGGKLQPWLQSVLRQSAERRQFSVGSSQVEVCIFRLNDPTASRYGLTIVFVVFSSQSYRLTIEDVRRREQPATAFSRVADKPHDLVLVNGGFWGPRHGHDDAIGIVVTQGKQLSPIWKWTSGGVLFRTQDLAARIVPIRDFKQEREVKEAIQSKLLLVEASRSGIRSDNGQLANRTAVGLTKDGAVIVAGAFQDSDVALSLYEFAQVLTNLPEQLSPKVDYALYMDGGPAAHILIPSLNLQFGDDGSTFVPNVVRFTAP